MTARRWGRALRQGGGPAGWRRTRRPPLRTVGRDPDYRFSLANERTFLAWIRTSLALLAAGVAVIQFVSAFSLPGGRLTLGIVLIVLSLLIGATSYSRWERTERAMRLGQPLPASLVPRLLAIGLTAVALIALILVLAGIGA